MYSLFQLIETAFCYYIITAHGEGYVFSPVCLSAILFTGGRGSLYRTLEACLYRDPLDIFKFVHYQAWTVRKWLVGIRLKCLLLVSV